MRASKCRIVGISGARTIDESRWIFSKINNFFSKIISRGRTWHAQYVYTRLHKYQSYIRYISEMLVIDNNARAPPASRWNFVSITDGKFCYGLWGMELKVLQWYCMQIKKKEKFVKFTSDAFKYVLQENVLQVAISVLFCANHNRPMEHQVFNSFGSNFFW